MTKKVDPIAACKKPSELIRLALKDLTKAERSPRYLVDMESWYDSDGKICQVCFGGAVMAFSYNINPLGRYLTPSDMRFGQKVTEGLFGLNAVRRGRVLEFVRYFYASRSARQGVAALNKAAALYPKSSNLLYEHKPNVKVPNYNRRSAKSKASFKKAMRVIATKLASVGL